MRVSSIEISGFRGIRKPLTLDFTNQNHFNQPLWKELYRQEFHNRCLGMAVRWKDIPSC